MSVNQERGKEKVVREYPHSEMDEFIIDFSSVVDPMAARKKVLHDLAWRLKKLASNQPQTPKIQ